MTTWLTDEPLLTAAEERALAREIEAGVLAGDLLATGSGAGVATAAELLALERAGQQAWQRFLLANLRLVWQVAHREARRSGLPADDLFQEGFLGWAVARRRWDHTRGIRFATLALPGSAP
ncbi:MAG: hypothetical protein IPL43_02405 [Micropruina sp.]|nr:hypothetical protein [Micropruina sp.]